MKNKKLYIVVSIDTECDKNPKWEIPKPIKFNNIKIQSQVLGALFHKYNVKPTYLLSPEVLYNDESLAILKKMENVEFGTHLHEEFIHPNADFETNRTKNIQADLSYDNERDKLENLTKLFYDKIGYYPKSFRSGRFGSSKVTTKILRDLGYKVDSSVTPFKTNYFDSGVKINGWGMPIEPYYEFKSNSDNNILQVPVTIINRSYSNLPLFVLKNLESKSTILKKVLHKLGYKTHSEWLRPYRSDKDGLIDIAEFVMNNHFKKKSFYLLNIMFHSNEILENASPYCKTEDEVKMFVESLDGLFEYLTKKYNVCFIGLGDVCEI